MVPFETPYYAESLGDVRPFDELAPRDVFLIRAVMTCAHTIIDLSGTTAMGMGGGMIGMALFLDGFDEAPIMIQEVFLDALRVVQSVGQT